MMLFVARCLGLTCFSFLFLSCIGFGSMGDGIDLDMGVTFKLSVPEAHGAWAAVEGTNS